ncbi:hypothetical protein AURDEDRAFT_199612 [Auricularia subglabra TFB-10046 SS5]|uniref:Carbohydrate esterase family 16 protein n=1 Tax=Auricularia subglabra (strain TFB-10046 / SS5) TaxID=717982 RepID=J0D064_AURST|nr:hypothetical protein AURDEDRAFT_199612 [Auricularia subglabra TFB-10046 SS5]
MQVQTLVLQLLRLVDSFMGRGPSSLPQFKNIVVFGDSFSDVELALNGGATWPVYLSRYTNATLHPFARGGATCSDNWKVMDSISVMESQIPAFESKQLTLPTHETVYSLWIGTNDAGAGALLTGSAPGFTIVDATKCAVDWVRLMYERGARYFVFQNMIPLQLIPMYAPNAHYNYVMGMTWKRERDPIVWHIGMTELVAARNALAPYMLRELLPGIPGAHLALFDSHALFKDIIQHPDQYLNGTAAPNVVSGIADCEHEPTGGPIGGRCPEPVQGTDRDSYLWYDELHPSEQADRVVAREMAKALKGNTKWATWIS